MAEEYAPSSRARRRVSLGVIVVLAMLVLVVPCRPAAASQPAGFAGRGYVIRVIVGLLPGYKCVQLWPGRARCWDPSTGLLYRGQTCNDQGCWAVQ